MTSHLQGLKILLLLSERRALLRKRSTATNCEETFGLFSSENSKYCRITSSSQCLEPDRFLLHKPQAGLRQGDRGDENQANEDFRRSNCLRLKLRHSEVESNLGGVFGWLNESCSGWLRI